MSNFVRQYVSEIHKELDKISNEDVLDVFKKMVNLEKAFAIQLRRSKSGKRVYTQFCRFILNSDGGIRSARPYFRLRQDLFLDSVNVAISKDLPKNIYKVPINYKFCVFAIKNIAEKDDRLLEIFDKISVLRKEIINRHLLLSLNRAKIFLNTTWGNNRTLEDLIQLANEALIIAVDKYVMDERASSFHAMIIGRMISSFIADSTSSIPVHIGNYNEKRLYQIKKLLQKAPGLTPKEISDILKIAEEDLSDLIGLTKCVSMDEIVDTPASSYKARRGDRIADAKSEDFANNIADNQIFEKMTQYYKQLSLIEKKILVLKGVVKWENL